MTVTFDPSTDFEDVVDGLESVTYTPRVSARAAADDSPTRYAGFHEKDTPDGQTLTNCLRRNVSNTDIAASDGHYVAGDTRWHLSANNLTTEPPLGSTIKDSSNDVYTILEVRKDTLSHRWRCICRNLRIVHSLDDLVTIQKATVTKGTAGAAEFSYANETRNIPARLQPISTTPQVVNGVRRASREWELILAADVTISPNRRVLAADGTYYEIMGDADTERLDMMQVVRVREWRRG